jgi:hypothetical protein
MSFDTVLFDSISSLNYTETNEIFLTREDKPFTVHIFRYEMQKCLLSATADYNPLKRF